MLCFYRGFDLLRINGCWLWEPISILARDDLAANLTATDPVAHCHVCSHVLHGLRLQAVIPLLQRPLSSITLLGSDASEITSVRIDLLDFLLDAICLLLVAIGRYQNVLVSKSPESDIERNAETRSQVR